MLQKTKYQKVFDNIYENVLLDQDIFDRLFPKHLKVCFFLYYFKNAS